MSLFFECKESIDNNFIQQVRDIMEEYIEINHRSSMYLFN